jgi:hypothetical protein
MNVSENRRGYREWTFQRNWHNKNTAQKDKRMGNTDTTKKLEMNIGALEG